MAQAPLAGAQAQPDLVAVPGGSFLMGTPLDRPERNTDETPHTVRVTGFLIARTEVTVAEFRAFAEAQKYATSAELGDGSWWYAINEWIPGRPYNWRNPGFVQGEDHPVTCVSWYDAVAYCNALSRSAGLNPVYSYRGDADVTSWPVGWNLGEVEGFDDGLTTDVAANGYRLPTEAEWEYACRGGPGAPDQMYSGGDDPDVVGWSKLNAGFGTRGVGQRAPNALGLLDMSGNVGEWCQDWYGTYDASVTIDPRGPTEGVFRVLRGGGWYSGYWYFLRSAYRSSSTPDYRCTIFGFRVARSADPLLEASR